MSILSGSLRLGGNRAFEIRPSTSGAIKGVIAGASAGKYFGPAGAVVGGLVGGITGAILGPEDSGSHHVRLP